MRHSPALVRSVGASVNASVAETRMPSRRGGARRSQPATYRRRLTAQAPLCGHRVVAARLSKIP